MARRLLADVPALVAEMGRQYRALVPEYAALTDADMAQEVLPMSERVVVAFFGALAETRHPDAGVLDDDLQAMSLRRLQMGVPLEPILHVYRVAGRVVWDAVVGATQPGEEPALADLAAQWMDFIDQASSIVAASYLHASHERLHRVDAARSALLDALLAATDASDVAAVATELGTTFAAAYVPALVAGPDAGTRIDAIGRVCPAGTIVGRRGQHVLLLVPLAPPPGPDVRRVAGGGVVVWGRPVPTGPALSAEVRHAEAMLHAALQNGRSGCFGPDELLLDRLVAGNARVAEVLQRRVADPLHRHDRAGLLSGTLRTYLSTGSVPATARAQVVHPNTVAYRLRRVAELTGLDPRVPADASLLVLALGFVESTSDER